MKRVVCAVFDRAAASYGSPFFVAAIGLATRSFQDEVNRPAQDNQLYLHPEDFDLYELGSFDDSVGRFVNSREFPELICNGVSVKTSPGKS